MDFASGADLVDQPSLHEGYDDLNHVSLFAGCCVDVMLTLTLRAHGHSSIILREVWRGRIVSTRRSGRVERALRREVELACWWSVFAPLDPISLVCRLDSSDSHCTSKVDHSHCILTIDI